MEILEDRLRSRFEWGLIVDISSPDFETRMAILRKKEELDGYQIDDQVIEYIAQNVKSNIRELEGSLNKIMAYANLENREINLALAEKVLKIMDQNWHRGEEYWIWKIRYLAERKMGKELKQNLQALKEEHIYLSSRGKEALGFWLDGSKK